jgi:hypothetical protein
MPTITLTNQVASQALRGENTKVTLSAADAANLSSLSVGMRCQGSTFSSPGYIYSIDSVGNSFEVIPAQPDFYFGAEGYLKSSVTVTVTL